MNSMQPQVCPSCQSALSGLPREALYCPRCGARVADSTDVLNPQQREAAEIVDGPAAVIAGAGSGKTRVIEYRVLNLIRRGIAPESILLLTFTRRAAREMMFRAARHDPRCKRIIGGTFHSISSLIIRENAAALGLDDGFRILDSADSADAIARCCIEFSRASPPVRVPQSQTLRWIFSKSVCTERSIAGILRSDFPSFEAAANTIEHVYDAYRAFKRENNFLDFDDLVLSLREMLRDEKLRQRIASRYRYVMVDEYQDTSAIEAQIAALLGHVHRNIMIVGDDAQSIYGFRGANFRNILAFPQQFPGCRVLKLEANYRSTQEILNLANAVLQAMRHKYSKCLRAANGAAGERPLLACTQGELPEATWVADQVRRQLAAGVSLHRQAVLYRASYISDALQLRLQERSIPFRVVGGPRITETAHVKAFVAYLQLLVDHRDALAWNRVLANASLGELESARLSEALSRCPNLPSALEQLSSAQRGTKSVAELCALLAEVSRSGLDPSGQCARVAEFFKPIVQRRYDRWEERAEDIAVLCRIAADYSDLGRMLAELIVDAPNQSSVQGGAAAKDVLTLSTIHSAKGLEWDVVFILGMSDEVFPDRRAMSDPDALEEEKRLLYVAVTRARSKLLLSSRGGEISRFLADPRVHGQLHRIQIESGRPRA